MRLKLALAIVAGFILVVWGSGRGFATPLELSMEGPSEARADGSVTFKMTLKNHTGYTIQLFLPPHPYEFTVEKRDLTPFGTTVWWPTYEEKGFGYTRDLRPGEKLTYQATWDLRGNDGRPVPPGDYRVRATLDITPPMQTVQPLHVSP